MSNNKYFPQVFKERSPDAIPENLLPPAPAPAPTKTTEEGASSSGGNEDPNNNSSEATPTTTGNDDNTASDNNASSTTNAPPTQTLADPELTLPSISADPTALSTNLSTARSLNKVDFLKSFTVDQIKQIKASEVIAEEALEEYKREKELAEQEEAEKKKAAEDATAENPEDATPPAENPSNDDETEATEAQPEPEPELPQPLQKSTLNREGGEIDSAMASIFRCISAFSGSFAAPPPPPTLSQETGEPTEPSTPAQTPFLWESIYPQNAKGRPIYNPDGKYAVKVFVAGKWRILELSDTVPCGEYDEPLILSSSNEGEIWPMLLAKACYYLWDATGARVKSDSVINKSSSDELRENAG